MTAVLRLVAADPETARRLFEAAGEADGAEAAAAAVAYGRCCGLALGSDGPAGAPPRRALTAAPREAPREARQEAHREAH